jgi:hypothetical protein
MNAEHMIQIGTGGQLISVYKYKQNQERYQQQEET